MRLYVAATNRVVSAVIVVEREENRKAVQRPVYYLSEVLSASKQNYPHYQKMAYGLYMAVTKLKHYFEEHPIKVVTDAPILDIINNKDASGRIAKWGNSAITICASIRETRCNQVIMLSRLHRRLGRDTIQASTSGCKLLGYAL